MQPEWFIITILLGVGMASIGAHPRICNLDLRTSLNVGLVSGVVAGAVYGVTQLTYSASLIPYSLSLISIPIAGAGIILWRFFRDPERVSPDVPDCILSPADGVIIYVREIRAGKIPCAIKGKREIQVHEIMKTNLLERTDGYIIGICMSLHDVHITRSPITGKVNYRHSTTGKTLSPKHWRSEVENPRTTMVFENPNIRIGIVEIGTPYVSKVISLVDEGDTVEGGQRIGKITWGSQVDVIIPSRSLKLLVNEADFVCAGETILARLTNNDRNHAVRFNVNQ